MIEIKDQKQVGTREFFTVVLPDGTEIYDCKLMTTKEGKEFISGPSRSYQDKDGNTKWVNLTKISFKTQEEILAVLNGQAVPDVDVAQQGMTDDDVPF